MPGTGRPWRTRVLHLGMILREALVGSSAGLDSVATSGLLTRPSMLPVRSANPIYCSGHPGFKSEATVIVNELRLGFSNTTRNPEGRLSHTNRKS
jgi:hypothetical protein